MSRVMTVARLHTVAWPVTMGWPWGIPASSFVLNIAIFGSIGDRVEGGRETGGLLSLYITVLIAAAQSVAMVFPYALGMSVTRRTFYAATALVVTAQSIAYAVPLYLLKLLERATGGWGVSMRFFAIRFMDVDNPLLQIAIYAVPLLFVSFLGMFVGVLFSRWGSNGTFAFVAAAFLGLALAAMLVTWTDAWRAVGGWLADQPAGALLTGWPLPIVAVLAGGGYLLIRRAEAS